MSHRLYVATRKGLFTVERDGSDWSITRADFLADNCLIVAPDRRDGSVYAALAHGHFGGKLHHSTDGKTWDEIAVPAYPEPPAGVEDRCPMSGRIIEWKLQQVWAMAPGAASQPGRVWCGTVPGGLFRSDDHGRSWTFVSSLWDHPSRRKWFGGGLDWPGIHSICVDPRDAERVVLGVSCGGVWETTNSGETWRSRADGMRAEYMPPELSGDPDTQDPHCLAMAPSNPDTMWVQHHNGIFKTTDGGAKWSELHGVPVSAFGFPVVVHPTDAHTAWFVPAEKDERRIPVDGRVVVTRTRDGGKTFDVLTEGLPQQHAYDITFRHAMDIDETGDRLAFGSTTGSLWVSENGGNTWQTVSRHLPPVYCVRFG